MILKIDIFSLQRIPKIRCTIFSCHFIEKMNFRRLNSDIQRSIKWRGKKIVQVLKCRCKGETLIFKTILDSVQEDNFLIFLHTFEFLQFSEKK